MSRVALVQTTSTDDFQANLATALKRVEEAAALGVDLIAFPEVFLFIGGAKGTATVSVTDAGNLAASGSVTITLYASLDGSADSSEAATIWTQDGQRSLGYGWAVM